MQPLNKFIIIFFSYRKSPRTYHITLVNESSARSVSALTLLIQQVLECHTLIT